MNEILEGAIRFKCRISGSSLLQPWQVVFMGTKNSWSTQVVKEIW
jgi:hypothetical protein